jgi:hypothetical protein
VCEQFVQLRHQVLRLRASDRNSSDQHDIDVAARPETELLPRSPEDPPGSVANHGAAHPTARDERHLPGAGRDKGYHPVSVRRPAFAQHTRDAGAVPRRPALSPRAWRGVWHDGGPGSRARRGSASERGTRASSCAAGCWVGTFAWTSRASWSIGRSFTGAVGRVYVRHRRSQSPLSRERPSKGRRRGACGKTRCYSPARFPPARPRGQP